MAHGVSAAYIAEVDETARQLYRQSRECVGPSRRAFEDVGSVVRGLHTVLKHLRAEADDPDSLLNSDSHGAVFSRRIVPVIEDVEFTLRQLETIIKNYGRGPEDGGSHAPRRNQDEVEDMIALVRTKLAEHKTSIDIFLDTVQLNNPSNTRRVVTPADEGPQLDAIKDKVDAIAAKLFKRRSSSIVDTDDDAWQQFKVELEKEGFSSDVLKKNKVWSKPLPRGA